MIPHAAEAGEDRGRVVVRLGASIPSSSAALAAAVHVARAFRAEVEALSIEETDVIAAATHERARIVAPQGGQRTIEKAALTAGLAHFATAGARQIAGHARAAGVPFLASVVRNDPLTALKTACVERGPWNIVAFAEPIASADSAGLLHEALTQVWGTTAFIAAGPTASWRDGPIVAVAEDVERLTALVRTAERLAAPASDPVLVLPAAMDAIGQDWLDGEVALTLTPSAATKILPRPPFFGPAAILSEIERYRPRLVLARYGGQVIPSEGANAALSALSSPVFMLH